MIIIFDKSTPRQNLLSDYLIRKLNKQFDDLNWIINNTKQPQTRHSDSDRVNKR